MSKNIATFLYTILILFILCEAGMRLYGFHGENVDFQPVTYSQELGWKLKTNYSDRWTTLEWSVPYRTNSQGFRDGEHAIQKDKNVFRIVVLGDSNYIES